MKRRSLQNQERRDFWRDSYGSDRTVKMGEAVAMKGAGRTGRGLSNSRVVDGSEIEVPMQGRCRLNVAWFGGFFCCCLAIFNCSKYEGKGGLFC